MTATETLTGTRTASTSFVVATDAVRPWQRHKRRQLGKTLVSFLLVIAMTVTTTTTDALSMSLSRSLFGNGTETAAVGAQQQ